MTGPLTAVEVAALIAGGEDSYTEFKAAPVANRDLAKELCAFLNAEGGRVLIGVENDGSLTGLGDWNEERAMNVARTALDPSAIPTWQIVDLTGVHIGILAVERGPDKPYAAGGGEGKRYYLRVGSTSREATREELLRLTQASGAVQPDLRPVPGTSAADLDDGALEWRFGGRRSVDWPRLSPGEREAVLVSAEILHPVERMVTIGGLLCFGAQPSHRLAQAEIVCAAYPGDTVGRELIDRDACGNRAEEQVERAAHFIARNLHNASTLDSVRRRDSPRPSLVILREVVANAVAHRDYTIAAPVNLRVFADRAEVLSPGSLPNGMTPAAMRLGATVRRNPFIVQHLAERGVVDALGRGILLATEESLERGLPAPAIEATEGFVLVTLRW